MKAHELANILLQGEDIPVAIPSTKNGNEANFIQDIDLYQHTDSPFERCLLLSSKDTLIFHNEIEIHD